MSKVETVTVTLLKPIKNGEEMISELTFREAEVGDLIDASSCANEMERMAVLMASVSGTPFPVFRTIKASDLKVIMQKVGDLVGNEI